MTDIPKKKVLVIDDEADIRTFVSTVLEVAGYEPVCAKDGREGVEAARIEKPDLVILDVMMPSIEDGVGCYRELKTDRETCRIPVIMLSAIARKTFFHTISRIHLPDGDSLPEPNAYMEKPPDAGELAMLVSGVMKP